MPSTTHREGIKADMASFGDEKYVENASLQSADRFATAHKALTRRILLKLDLRQV